MLARYINGGCLSRSDQLIAFVAPRWPFRVNARNVSVACGPAESGAVLQAEGVITVTIPPYSGSNAFALELRDYLSRFLADDLTAALVHGSIATGEEVGYSDFDALAVVRDEVVRNPRRLANVAHRLDGARRIMLRFDPLQHHGWFALAEHQLRNYPESYLPIEVLRHSRSLLPVSDVIWQITPVFDLRTTHIVLQNVSVAIAERIARGQLPRNVFELKSLLSQFMLLPALYVEVREGRGVFKKDSFARARTDFDPDTWSIMDEVSDIRLNWTVPWTALQRRVLSVRSPLSRRVVRHFAPAIPASLASKLDLRFYQRMGRLATAFVAATNTQRVFVRS